jgi:ABC-2 type transport system permease protein
MMETVAFNEDMSYAEFLIPAIIALIIHQMMLMTMGIRLGEINMKGEWEDLLKRSGDSPTVLIWGIRTVQGLLFGGQLFLIYLLIPLVYGYHFDILNPWVLTGMAVFIISLGSMGMVIGSFIRRPERAVMLIAPFSVVLFILSGWSWPLEAMPWSVRWIALLLPSTPYLQLFQKAVMYHADASAVMPHLLHLVVLSVIWYWVAHYFFRKLIMKFHTERTKDKR